MIRRRGPLPRLVLDGLARFAPDAPDPRRRARRADLNEDHHRPLPGVLDAVRDASAFLNEYPNMASDGLREAVARQHGVDADRIALGAGGTAVLQQTLLAMVEPGDDVVLPDPSFETFATLARVVGGEPRRVPRRGPHQDLDALARAVGPRTRVAYVCSPDNPTGTLVDAGALASFADAVPDRTLVVVDEAYREFVRDATRDAVDLARDRDDVAVLRTFSKAYGLAGMRVGYLVAPEPVAAAVRRTALPFGITRPAEAAALASLAAETALAERVRDVAAERERLTALLRERGVPVIDSHANFVWLPLGHEAGSFADACTAHGVDVHLVAGHGVRITVGARRRNDLVLRTADALAAPHARAG